MLSRGAAGRAALIRSALTVTLTLVVTACASGGDGGAGGGVEDGLERPAFAPVPGRGSPGGPREPIVASSTDCVPGAFFFLQDTCVPAHSVPLDEIVSGGPPPDGIPPIDEPVYESVEDAATWLTASSPVMVIDIDDDVRVYPLAILTWHEIVNDVVGGVPVVVTYCPLCNSALVFERTLRAPDGDVVLDFGTSGRLYRSNLVMYDRQTRNLWTQFEGEGIVGEEHLGDRLTRLPAWLFGFDQLRDLHPDARVLSRDTGFNRDYGRNPYVGYDADDNRPFLFRGEVDARFAPMTRMVGITSGDDALAVVDALLREARTVTITIDGRELVVLWGPGQASALDTADIDAGRDVGQTAVYDTTLDGATVELEPSGTDGLFTDRVSGSRFDLRGRATDGPLEGRQLRAVPHDDTFWFVWVAFRPDTVVIDRSSAR
jgi:hypothetical protein